jgi:large subunit ribosomal protein L15
MQLHELYPHKEEQKQRKRIGRGSGSGAGCTAGKGNKGQLCRAGSGPRPGFEGGQMPLQRRLPKRGFKNLFRVEYSVISLKQLEEKFSGKDKVSLEDLYSSGLCTKNAPIKILSDGELKTPLKVEAHKFSQKAAEKIRQAGGEAVALEG